MTITKYLVVAALAWPNMAHADPITLKSNIKLAWLGLGVARLKTEIRFSEDRYEISGNMKTTGVVKAVTGTKGTFSTSGRIRGRTLIPDAHKMAYSSGKKKGGVSFVYSGGDLVERTVSPKVKYKKGTVPVESAHFRDVLDPVSATLFAVRESEVGNGAAVCNRTLPVFDGKNRMNIVFRYKSTGIGRAKGFSGETFTCLARYKPVSGHRPFKKNVKFMKANRNLEITLARVGESNVYGLFAFKVATGKGTASGFASRFETN